MKMHSKFRYMYDAAPAVSLAAQGSAAKTANFAGAPLTLDTLDGYWTTAYNELADQTMAVVINVTDIAAPSSETGTLTLNVVVAGDQVTISDGAAEQTFVAATDFEVGLDDNATAVNIANAIAASSLNVDAAAALNVVTVTNLNPSGLAFTGASATIVPSAVSGADESYVLDLVTNNGVIVGTATVGAVGQYVLLLDMETVQQADPNVTTIQLDGTISGTDPSVTFFAWFTGIQK